MNQQERAEISGLLKDLRSEGLCQLLVEHDVQMMIDTCDHVFAMNFGKLIAEGVPRTSSATRRCKRPTSAGSGATMLEIKDLHVSYGNVQAVRGVGMTVTPGKVTLVLGANGAGKTTTLKAIAGLLPPDSGTVVLEGKDITGLAPHKVVRHGISLVPEGRRVFGPLTVVENLRMGAYTAPKANFDQTLARVHEMFPILQDRADSAAGLLVGGEQQMLAFGRALMSEPTSCCSTSRRWASRPSIVDSILAKVRDMADSGIGILMVEQNAEAGLDVADDVVAVARGEVVYAGPAAEARNNASVLRAFLGEAALAGTAE